MAKSSSLLLVTCLVLAACGGSTDEAAAPASVASPAESEATASSASVPVPHPNYALQWVSNDMPATLARGTAVRLAVGVKNTGDWTWLDPLTPPARPTGAYAVRLVHSWLSADGEPVQDGARTDLVGPVAPGETVTFTLEVKAPPEPGEYKLQLDLVEELLVWFGKNGSEELVIPVNVV